MRRELLYNPALLCERLAELSREHRRLRKLRGTVASKLTSGHIDSLELLELIRPLNPGVICDVGANVGTWTRLAKAIFPNAKIYAFEPLEAHCAAFDVATRSLGGVTLHKCALGSNPANLRMRVLDRSDASSLLPITSVCRKAYGLQDDRTEAVTVQRLDDVLRANSIPQPDLLKLDVQGYELEALRGAALTLRATKAILTEVSFVELYEGQCLFHHVVGHLAASRFHLYALAEHTPLGKSLLQADALFIAESVRSQLML